MLHPQHRSKSEAKCSNAAPQGSGQRSRTRSAIAAVQLLGNGGQRRRPRTDECQHGDECQPGNKRNVVTTLSLLVGDRHTRRGPVRPSLGGCNDCHLGYRSFAHELSALYGVFNSRNRRESISRIGAGKRSAFIPDLQQNPSLGGVLFIFGNRETLSILWFTNFQMSARKEHWASIRLNEIPRCCLCLNVSSKICFVLSSRSRCRMTGSRSFTAAPRSLRWSDGAARRRRPHRRRCTEPAFASNAQPSTCTSSASLSRNASD